MPDARETACFRHFLFVLFYQLLGWGRKLAVTSRANDLCCLQTKGHSCNLKANLSLSYCPTFLLCTETHAPTLAKRRNELRDALCRDC